MGFISFFPIQSLNAHGKFTLFPALLAFSISGYMLTLLGATQEGEMNPIEFIEKYMRGKCFYHFTDTRNIASIKSQGGLFSLRQLRQRGILPTAPGGNQWSHEADERLGLDSYVHLCFLDQHPMEWRVKHPAVPNFRYEPK